jgi:glycosyltransferase involved in cell wall biosynthesis
VRSRAVDRAVAGNGGTGLIESPLWSVLVPTLASRREKLRRLLDVLLPQAEAHGGVEVVGLHNNGEKGIAEYRQALLEDARGSYISFVDDDDIVEPGFVEAVTAAMEGGADYIAFWNQFYRDGVKDDLETWTGINYNSWYDEGHARIRDVVHVCPARAELAKQCDFRKESAGSEDWSYISQLRGLLQTQAVVPRVLYHYYWTSTDSVQHSLAPHTHSARLPVCSPAFRWHHWSSE